MAINKTVAGTFAVDFRDKNGKRHQKTFEKHRAAVAYEKEALAKVQTGEYIAPSNETVEQIAKRWHARKIDAGTYKRSSLEQWGNHVKRFITPELGGMRMAEIDGNVEAVERALAAWAERVSPVTANKTLTSLTAVLDLAKRYKLIRDNAARYAERLKIATDDEGSIEVPPDKVYTKTELGKLIKATEPGSRDRLLIMVPALLGLRIGEVLALTWPAIDLKAGKLSVILNLADSGKGEEPLFQSPKTKSSRRTLSLSQELIRELKVWKLKCPNSERALVFTTEDGKPMHRKSASKILDRAIAKAELAKRLTPHGLRHSFASLLLADSVPVPEVSAYLGHKDCAITLKIYAHFVREETRAVHNLAASILAGQN